MKRWALISMTSVGLLAVPWLGPTLSADQPSPAAPAVPAPKTTVGDVAALPPPERAAFIMGYFAASAQRRVATDDCAARWFYEKGGAARLEQQLAWVNTGKAGDADSGPPPAFYRSQPIATYLQLTLLNACAGDK